MLLGSGSRSQSVQGTSHRIIPVSDQRGSRPSPSVCPGDRTPRTVKPSPSLCSAWIPTGWKGSRRTLVSENTSTERREVSSDRQVEKSKSQGRSQQDFLMDVISGPYLSGQWPRELSQALHTCTQNPGSWTSNQRELKKHSRLSSWCSADHQREITRLRVLVRQSVLGRQRKKEMEALSSCDQVQTKLHPASFSSAAVSTTAVCASSFNDTKLDRVFVSNNWREQQEKEVQAGGGTPVPPHQSSSPLPLLVNSVKPNNSPGFKRFPPEGSEKVKVFEETASHDFSYPDSNRASLVLRGAGPISPPAPIRLRANLQERSPGRAGLAGRGPRKPLAAFPADSSS